MLHCHGRMLGSLAQLGHTPWDLGPFATVLGLHPFPVGGGRDYTLERAGSLLFLLPLLGKDDRMSGLLLKLTSGTQTLAGGMYGVCVCLCVCLSFCLFLYVCM